MEEVILHIINHLSGEHFGGLVSHANYAIDDKSSSEESRFLQLSLIATTTKARSGLTHLASHPCRGGEVAGISPTSRVR